jgi:oligo-1,6-glucosidase
MNPTYPQINLKADRQSPDSVFAYYQKLIAMRREHPAVIEGTLEFLLEGHPQMIVYLRKCREETLLILANKSDEEVPVGIPERIAGQRWKRILTNRENTEASLDGRESWLPWEAEIYASLNVL